jgi:hypothetical protein
VSIRNRCFVDLSVMKRQPMAVTQACAAAVIISPAGCRCRAENSFAPCFRSVGGTSRLLKQYVWGATCCRGGSFWGLEGRYLELDGRSLELERKSLERGQSLSALRAATRRGSSSMQIRSSLLSVDSPMLAIEGGGTVSMLRSAQSAAASSSTSGWQARVVYAFAGSRLVQMVRRK